MTMNDMDVEALLLDQTCFALDAVAFATFQGLVEPPRVAWRPVGLSQAATAVA